MTHISKSRAGNTIKIKKKVPSQILVPKARVWVIWEWCSRNQYKPIVCLRKEKTEKAKKGQCRRSTVVPEIRSICRVRTLSAWLIIWANKQDASISHCFTVVWRQKVRATQSLSHFRTRHHSKLRGAELGRLMAEEGCIDSTVWQLFSKMFEKDKWKNLFYVSAFP